mmetsp:Transcript_7340/g.21688  ORF Transcript_7340/g.21688 Transcript_7340/m.21688 type:complete len:747 (+) Transcript_7340:499-2739(+)
MLLSAATVAVMVVTVVPVGARQYSSAKERDFAVRAGLERPLVGDNVLSPFDTSTAGTFFSGAFTNNTVLQRSPQIAAVYGYTVGCGGASKCVITVDITEVAQTTPPYQVAAAVTDVPGRNYSRWKAMLKPTAAGGNYTVTVSGAHGGVLSRIHSVTFGDVFFCSGQSNMWLVMHFDTSRNATYDAILKGKYSNIRMWTMPMNNQPDGGIPNYDLYISPPPPPYNTYGGFPVGGWMLPDVGTYANETCRNGHTDQGCTPYPQPDDTWCDNNVDQFSAACWHAAQHLTDIMEANNETVVPLGMIHSSWGGTMVEMWQPNASLNAAVCKNSSGGPYAPWQNGRWDINSGALWNGMVLPVVNMTIKGAFWWQGENNVFQCHNADSNEAENGDSSRPGSAVACGSVKESTGYACMMQNLIKTWREAWSKVPGTTPPDFPFGLVTLAGGTSEGHGNNMGAFRYAQSGNTGYLNPTADNTFVAAAYDAGDPCSGGNFCCTNRGAGQGYACIAGEAPYTGQFMGGIHPRVKKIVGMRLAKGARALAYRDTSQIFTGPVLTGCTLEGTTFTLTFDPDMLKDDAILVVQNTDRAIPFADDLGAAWSPALLSVLQQLGPETPMEVQLNGDPTNATTGVWLPANIQSKCSPVDSDHPSGGSAVCSINSTTGAKLSGWNQVTFTVPGSIVNNVTAIRYAWGENPCCPSTNRMVAPCPPLSCPIQTFNSSLPAVPFWATIKGGQCNWISTQGPPPSSTGV